MYTGDACLCSDTEQDSLSKKLYLSYDPKTTFKLWVCLKALRFAKYVTLLGTTLPSITKICKPLVISGLFPTIFGKGPWPKLEQN